MPRYVYKTAPDKDEYIEWSTIVDAPVGIMNKAQFLEKFGEERAIRTDKRGTSAYTGEGEWDDDGIIYMGIGMLPRFRLTDVFAECLKNNWEIPEEWLSSLFKDHESTYGNSSP